MSNFLDEFNHRGTVFEFKGALRFTTRGAAVNGMRKQKHVELRGTTSVSDVAISPIRSSSLFPSSSTTVNYSNERDRCTFAKRLDIGAHQIHCPNLLNFTLCSGFLRSLTFAAPVTVDSKSSPKCAEFITRALNFFTIALFSPRF